MSTPSQPPQRPDPTKPDAEKEQPTSQEQRGEDVAMGNVEVKEEVKKEEEIEIPKEILEGSPEEIMTRVRLLENEIKILRSETGRLRHAESTMKEKIKENKQKISSNKQLPYLVANVVEILDIDPDYEEEGEGEEKEKKAGVDGDGDVEMGDADGKKEGEDVAMGNVEVKEEVKKEEEIEIPKEILEGSPEEIMTRVR
ncbi:hypothetical protein BT69DRAFT_1349431 [Atractiella rhizophila]|nr:hypothetical protein BT69DRAFT_1349431 [Atractiella rhizophila]